MNIDRVAKAMTAVRGPRGWRGPSGPAFTARVMAPIDGRPAPGFTSRVMKGIDAPGTVAQGFSPALRLALLVPAAVAIAAGTFALTRGAARYPVLPAAPTLATNGGARMPASSAPARVQPAPALVARAVVSPTVALPEPSPIYQIAALEGPADIVARDIQPATCTIPALDGPAPLKLKDIKEQP